MRLRQTRQPSEVGKLTIRTRVIIIIGVALLATGGLLYAISRFTFIRGLEEIEENHVSDTVEQVLNAYSHMASGLEVDTANWAASEASAFIAAGSPDYAASSLIDETMASLELSQMVLVDGNGDILFSRAFDLVGGVEAPFPASLANHLSKDNNLIYQADTQSFGTGIILLEEGPLLVATQPIRIDGGAGVARGTLVFGRYLASSVIDEITQLVGLPVTMQPVNKTSSPDFVEALASLSATRPVYVRQMDSQYSGGYAILEDIYGEPAVVLRVEIPRDAYNLGQRTVIYYIVAVVVAQLLVAVGALMFLQKQVLSRFSWLISGIDAIAESGDTSQRVSVGGGDELASIAGTVNAMLSTIEADAHKMRQGEDELRVHYELEKEIRMELEEETKKRTEFTRALVHELRTPITPVLAATELLLESNLEGQSLRLVESIDRSAANLNRRIDELVDLIRGETDMLPLALQPVNVISLLRDLADEMTPVASAAGHVLTTDLPEDNGTVLGDSDRLRQIVQNLMNNAIKFTPSGGKITLLARALGDILVIEVRDSGPGIAEEDLARLFDPYYRRVEDRERLSGLGLGLALSKRLVELHGGKIWVKSQLGVGTTLGFSLPLMPPDEDENEVTP